MNETAYKHRETIEYRTPDGGVSTITVGLTPKGGIRLLVARDGRTFEASFAEQQAQSISDMILRAIAAKITG